MFMLGCGDMEATREVGECALTAVGIHVAEGVLVWEVVLMVEKQVSIIVSLILIFLLLRPGIPTLKNVERVIGVLAGY